MKSGFISKKIFFISLAFGGSNPPRAAQDFSIRKEAIMNNKLVIKLFKKICCENTGRYSERALEHGILMPACDEELIDYAIKLYGKDGEAFNATFHKSFSTVKNTDNFTLFMQQMMHYITTYGTNFTSPYVYIPTEELDIPKLDVSEVKLINISCINKEELKGKIITLCKAALSEEIVSDVTELINDTGWFNLIEDISNKEVKCRLYKETDEFPKDPDEFLRYMIYLSTGETLKIKNDETYQKIACTHLADRCVINNILKEYIIEYGYQPLASIFIPNKKLFLAFKDKDNASIMNKLNKLGKNKNIRVYHEKSLSEEITNCEVIFTEETLKETLLAMPISKHIAVLNSLYYLGCAPEYTEYRVRNGKSFFTEAKSKNKILMNRRAFICLKALAERISPSVKGKYFYIPNGLNYNIPTSEKNFIGNIPNKSSVVAKSNEAFIVAIEWEVDCDIDLSVIEANGDKVGWNTTPKNSAGTILFSGDMTELDDAGRACEAVYLDTDEYNGNVKVNLYSNWSNKDEIPFKLIIAKADKEQYTIDKNYVINPNSVIETVNLKFDSKTKELNIGHFNIDKDEMTFVFDLDKTSGSNVSTYSEVDKMRMAVNKVKIMSSVSLTTLLKIAGAKIITDPNKLVDYTDLSLEAISKETLLSLFN